MSGDAAPAVEAVDLPRRFGEFTAVDALSFSVQPGEVFGFLGPNGSGKTTTIRMLCGILAPSAGQARVLGHDVMREVAAVKARIGYMNQRFALYDELSARENLRFYGGVYGVAPRDLDARAAELIQRFNLGESADRMVVGLPSGIRQRVAFAAAAVHDPKILFLDEPTAAVEPGARREFWDMIYDLGATGTTIFVTTHFMDEAEYCNRLALMNQGRLIACDSPAGIRGSLAGGMLEIICERPASALDVLVDQGWVKAATLLGRRLHVLLGSDGSEERVVAQLAAADITIQTLHTTAPSLEDAFVALTSEPTG